jgi:hypothetical protein
MGAEIGLPPPSGPFFGSNNAGEASSFIMAAECLDDACSPLVKQGHDQAAHPGTSPPRD